MQITNKYTVAQALNEYPYLFDEVLKMGEPFASAARSPLFKLVQNMSIEDICRKFSLDEAKVLRKLNDAVNEHEAGKFILRKYINQNGVISTPTMNKLVEEVLGHDASYQEKALFRIAIKTSTVPLAEITLQQFLENILAVEELADSTIWESLLDGISETTKAIVKTKCRNYWKNS